MMPILEGKRMMTQEDEAALSEFLETSGALEGLDPKQARAVCVDLVWKVSLIVNEAVDRSLGRELSCSS
jgi:hypothetical protein